MKHRLSPPEVVQLTLPQLRQVKHFATSVEEDAELLHQLRRILPAKMAGVSQWAGKGTESVWVRFHWYFDEVRNDFVIPAHGLQTNIVLVCSATGTALSRSILYRSLLRRLRRRTDWQPFVRIDAGLRGDPQLPAVQGVLRQAAIAPRAQHRDGTDAWAQKMVREWAALPTAEQFGQLAKAVRLKFGFDQTLIYARSAADPTVFAIQENHRPAWSEVYSSEQLAMVDPRLHLQDGPTCWSSTQWQAENPAFWTNAIMAGIGHGWLMPSIDGRATMVISRGDRPIDDDELALIQPNLVALAQFAHALMLGQLEQAPAGGDGLEMPEFERLVLMHLDKGMGRKEIATLYRISIPKLDRHIAEAKRILGVKSKVEALNRARALGVLTLAR